MLLPTNLAKKLCEISAAQIVESEGSNKPSSAARTMGRASTINGAVNLAKSETSIAASKDQWDIDQFILNMPKGQSNLSKGGWITQNNRNDYCTKSTAVTSANPGSQCPIWLSFLKKAMACHADLIQYIQRLSGYCLTGSTTEHALFFLYGTGANGKSVFINTIRSIFGDYHTTAPIETFTVTNSNSHPTDLAGLRGARLVTAVETEEGRVWAEAALTGGDEISERFMRMTSLPLHQSLN